MGRPKETIGIATATIVGAFCDPARASAANMNPMNRLPESPKKMVAGWKLKRRKPNVAPANAIVRKAISGFGTMRDITKTTMVEKSAEPAASPSNPSIRLNAFVISSTHNIVSGKQ